MSTFYNVGTPTESVSLAFGNGQPEHYGKPMVFSMPAITQVTACSWLRVSPAFSPVGGRYEYLFSYYADSKRDQLNLFTGNYYHGERVGVFINEEIVTVDEPDFNHLHFDNQWHQLCFSWRNSDGQVNIFSNGQPILTQNNVKTNVVIPGEGELVICQRTEGGTQFQENKYCFGDVAGINIWDFYSDANNIGEVNDCTSKGNIFHFDLNMMDLSGKLYELSEGKGWCRQGKKPTVELIDNSQLFLNGMR